MSYSNSNLSSNEISDLFKKWIPEKVRPGKVPNALNTAITTWKLINHSLTKENISNGLTIKDMNDISNKYNLELKSKTELQKFIDHSKKYLPINFYQV